MAREEYKDWHEENVLSSWLMEDTKFKAEEVEEKRTKQE